ncbi:hypothetical protein P0D69_40110, partial [Paraburkholderia sediminicola]|uniref:hypothetical protein n=1 Tax=Paraburkholderia sediminicola TaxID=458836 RepID=UPI0038BA080B
MKFDALFEAGFKELGARFFLVAFLPALLIVLLIVALHASGAPAQAPSWLRFSKALSDFDITKLVGLVLVVLVISVISMPLQESLVRVFEGYWGAISTTKWFGQLFLNWQKSRRASLVFTVENVPANPTPKELSIINSAARRLSKYYPTEPRLLPTALGNVLRAAEDLATGRYGLDSVVIWPRLYPFIGPGLGRLVDSARNQLDISVRLIPTFVACAMISFWFLQHYGWWLLLPCGFLAVAALSYRASVEAAAAFGVAMNTAIDLYRFDMLKGLHMPMPSNCSDERANNKAISSFLRQGVPHGILYAHPKSDELEKSKIEKGD